MPANIIEAHHPQCYEFLHDHFQDREIEGIEVGTLAGDLTARLLSSALNLKLLITIDPWKHKDGDLFEAGRGQDWLDSLRDQAKAKLAQFGTRCVIWQDTSDNALTDLILSGKKFDFVWIDGDHNYEQVRRDIAHAKALVKDGGLIGGHDYGTGDRVKEAVHEAFGQNVELGGDLTWMSRV